MTRSSAERLTAVVVDDEPPARRTLELLLQKEPDVDVIAGCGDALSACAVILERRPDLVFLDIQIPGGDGFDVLETITPEHRPAVAFVTAYDAYAVRAFEAHAVDYLLKPFTDERFAALVERMRHAIRVRDLDEIERRLRALVEATSAMPTDAKHLIVRDGHRTVVLPLRDIQWIEAEDYYVRIHAGPRRPLVRRSLQSLAAELGPSGFARVHRSAIVNLDHVREIRPGSTGDHELVLASGAVIRLSRTLKEAVTARLRPTP
jgi:two-component system LytT family response regulator